MDMIKKKKTLKLVTKYRILQKMVSVGFSTHLYTNRNKQIWLTLLLWRVVVFFYWIWFNPFRCIWNITPRIYQTAEMDLDIVWKNECWKIKKIDKKWRKNCQLLPKRWIILDSTSYKFSVAMIAKKHIMAIGAKTNLKIEKYVFCVFWDIHWLLHNWVAFSLTNWYKIRKP